MSIQYRIDGEHELVLAFGQGTLTGAALQAYVRSVLTDPDVRPHFCELFDARRVVTVDISTSDTTAAIGTIQAFAQGLKRTKSALVASPDNVEEVARIYELLRVSVPATVRLFTEMAEARAWLGLEGDGKWTVKPRRAAPRENVNFTTLLQHGIHEVSAQVVNISVSGALIEASSIFPVPGAIIKMQFGLPEIDPPIEVTGRVVRCTEDGLAVEFVTMTEELRELLGGLMASRS